MSSSSEVITPEIVYAGLDRWGDVTELLGVSGETGCFCQPWRGFDTKARSGGKTRPQLLEEQMRTGPPSPGYLAYHEGVAVGWVGVSVRTQTPRLLSSRTMSRLYRSMSGFVPDMSSTTPGS